MNNWNPKIDENLNDLKGFVFIAIILFLLVIDIYASPIKIESYINIKNCDKIIEKENYSICYSYKNNGPLYTLYNLDGELVNKNNIKKRPRFYEESTLPLKYQVKSYQYTNIGYNRGHLTSDASFDYSLPSLQSVYTMANIIPQVPQVNAHKNLWAGLEIKERELAVLYKTIVVINKVNYPSSPHTSQFLKGSSVVIPSSFEKHFITDNIKTCYKIENKYYEIVPNNIELFKIVCPKD